MRRYSEATSIDGRAGEAYRACIGGKLGRGGDMLYRFGNLVNVILWTIGLLGQ